MTSYEALLYLNNLGVTLLQRNQYQESMTTFQDAVRVHRCCYYNYQHRQRQHQQQPLEPLSTNDKIMIQEKLRNASERLAQSTYSFTDYQTNDNQLIIDPMIVLDITNDDCFNTMLRYGSSIDQIDFVIRMKDYDSSDALNHRDLNLDYAILLLNLGVASKRSSEVVTDDTDENDEYFLSDDEYKNNLRDQSTQLFHVSHQIVSEALQKLTDPIQINSKCNNNNDNLRTILHTTMISMFTSSHISDMMYWCHSIEDGIQYHTKFEKLYHFFQLLIQEYIKRCGGTIHTTNHAAVA